MITTQYLDRISLAYKAIPLTAPVHTATDVQRACNCTLAQVLKALLFIAGNIPVLAVVPGDRKVDKESLRTFIGATSLRMATPEEVLAKTGYQVGTVSPFNAGDCRLVVDSKVKSLDTVIVGSGDPLLLIEVRADALLSSTRAQLTPITL